jgi:isopentenyl-diphosphate delta-isomerase
MRESRKMEHVRHALATGQSRKQGLEDITFVHNCLPESSLNRIALNTRIGDLMMRSPILINAMTGGALETERINRDLAEAANECGIAMAVGSQMSAIKNPEVRSSYSVVRVMNPKGIIISNLGSEATVEQAQTAVDMIDANALQIHLNVVQELVMPEGDRDFTGMLDRITRICETLSVPVIVKEVGFGMTAGQARQLQEAGVTLIDVGGHGGTNFASIENERRVDPMQWFNTWGNTTSTAILECAQIYKSHRLIASGGITNPLEITKALALGASAVGLAGLILRQWNEAGAKGVVDTIQQLEQQTALIMTALGAETISDLWRVPLVIQGETLTWCEQRGIDTTVYARRNLLSKKTTLLT